MASFSFCKLGTSFFITTQNLSFPKKIPSQVSSNTLITYLSHTTTHHHHQECVASPTSP